MNEYLIQILIGVVAFFGASLVSLVVYIWSQRVKMFDQHEERQNLFNIGLSAQFKETREYMAAIHLEVKDIDSRVNKVEYKTNGLRNALSKLKNGQGE